MNNLNFKVLVEVELMKLFYRASGSWITEYNALPDINWIDGSYPGHWH